MKTYVEEFTEQFCADIETRAKVGSEDDLKTFISDSLLPALIATRRHLGDEATFRMLLDFAELTFCVPDDFPQGFVVSL